MAEPRSLSRSVEDYLKAVFNLTERGEAASTSALADALEVQPASVTGMIKRLAESGLLEHLPYRGVRLTDKRRIRLDQQLVEKDGPAGIGKEPAHDQAAWTRLLSSAKRMAASAWMVVES